MKSPIKLTFDPWLSAIRIEQNNGEADVKSATIYPTHQMTIGSMEKHMLSSENDICTIIETYKQDHNSKEYMHKKQHRRNTVNKFILSKAKSINSNATVCLQTVVTSTDAIPMGVNSLLRRQ